jgi:hypothetical protein
MGHGAVSPRGPVARPLALLLGEVNPYQQAEVEHYALYPYPERSAGGRLCRVILGLEPGVYLRAYARHNLCSGKWSLPAARARAAELLLRYPEPLPIALLGAKVAEAFGQPFEPFRRAGRFVVFPHPSGLSRLWNEPGAFAQARELMRDAGAMPSRLAGATCRWEQCRIVCGMPAVDGFRCAGHLESEAPPEAG